MAEADGGGAEGRWDQNAHHPSSCQRLPSSPTAPYRPPQACFPWPELYPNDEGHSSEGPQPCPGGILPGLKETCLSPGLRASTPWAWRGSVVALPLGCPCGPSWHWAAELPAAAPPPPCKPSVCTCAPTFREQQMLLPAPCAGAHCLSL